MVILGGAAWHYFFNKDRQGIKLELTFDGKSQTKNTLKLDDFFDELKKEGFSEKVSYYIQSKIFNVLNKFIDKEAKTKISFFIRRGEEYTMDVEALKDGEIVAGFNVPINQSEINNKSKAFLFGDNNWNMSGGSDSYDIDDDVVESYEVDGITSLLDGQDI